MTTRGLRPIGLFPFLLALAACEATKSANPLSPSVAGPIAGVSITAPKTLEPGDGWKVGADKQPLTLLLENASTTGVRPLNYRVEIAADSGFGTVLVARDGVAPGTGGRTSLTLTDRLAPERTYYWRTRAEDGANTGPYSAAAAFTVFTPISLGPPDPLFPINGATTSDARPFFQFRNAAHTGPVGPVTYAVEVANDAAFGSVVAVFTGPEQGGDTRVDATQDLPLARTFYWRVRGFDASVLGPWSVTRSFKTPAVPTGGGGGGGGGGGSGGSCASRDGHYIARCVMAKYPDRLRAGVSASERHGNMEFLRDRMIEAGLCGGLIVGWNLKRGVGPRSVDALAWDTNGRMEVVDVGVGYDDTSQPLQLQWAIVAGPAGFEPYPMPSCR